MALSNKVKLTDEEKIKIFHCIRYNFLDQKVLLQLSFDNDFALAKAFIVQALAFKLGGEESFASDELKITTRHRHVVSAANARVAELLKTALAKAEAKVKTAVAAFKAKREAKEKAKVEAATKAAAAAEALAKKKVEEE